MRYWKRVDGDGNTTSVESYSHNLEVEGAVEISQGEYDAYITSLPEPPPFVYEPFVPAGSAGGVGDRVTYIEEFLVRRYPQG